MSNYPNLDTLVERTGNDEIGGYRLSHHPLNKTDPWSVDVFVEEEGGGVAILTGVSDSADDAARVALTLVDKPA